MVSFAVQKCLSFSRSYLMCSIRKAFSCAGVQGYPPISLLSDLVFLLSLNSLIHLELNFVQSDKCGFLCILLYVVIRFDQHLWLKMMSFPVFIFDFFIKKKSGVHKCVDICLGLPLDSIDHVSFCASTMKFLLLKLCNTV